MPLINFEQFKTTHERITGLARKNLTTFGHVIPILHLFHLSGHEEILALKGLDLLPPDASMNQILSTIITQQQAGAYLFTNEAWLYTMTQAEKDFLKAAGLEPIRARHHPNRQECILVTGEHPEGRVTSKQMFHRAADLIIFDGPAEYLGADVTTIVGTLLHPQG